MLFGMKFNHITDTNCSPSKELIDEQRLLQNNQSRPFFFLICSFFIAWGKDIHTHHGSIASQDGGALKSLLRSA